MPLAPGDGLGPYTVVSLLGAGGMGEVYSARDTRLGRTVAIKVLRSPRELTRAQRQRFLQEARAVSALNHPHIVTLHDIGHHEGLDYLVMECVEGHSLADRIGPRGLPLDEALGFAVAIADALAQAHAAGILHRDLKPSNILITADGNVKVVDFGLAKVIDTLGADDAATATAVAPTGDGALVGTPAYMSPEQAEGHPVDARTDVFSFGAVLYEMVTGVRAFRGTGPASTLSAVLREEPRAPTEFRDDLPAELERLIQRCLGKRAAARPSSMREVAVALRVLRDAVPAQPSAPVRAGGAKRRLRARALAAAVLTAGAAAAWHWSSTPGQSDVLSILALPAAVYGGEEFGYLTDAVPATLSTHLARIEGIETKLPPSSVDVQPVRGDLRRIAAAYGAGALVVSSVTAEPNRLILDLQLVDPRTRHVRWSRQYAGDRQSYVDLVSQAADDLRLALRPAAASVRVPPAEFGTSDVELALRRGQFYATRYDNAFSPPDFDAAYAALREALELDPAEAEAAALIAELFVTKFKAGAPAGEMLLEVERWAHRALEIDSRSGRGWAALMGAESMRPRADRRRMLEYGLRAVVLAPACAVCQNNLAVALSMQSVELGSVSLREAHRLAPLHLNSSLNLAEAHRDMGRYAEAVALLDEVLYLEPRSSIALQLRTHTLAQMGQLDESVDALRQLKLHVAEGRLPAFFYDTAEHAWARARGDATLAAASLARILAAVDGPDASAHDAGYLHTEVIPALARAGMIHLAFEVLHRGMEMGAIPAYDWLLLHPDLTLLRDEPRFERVLATARDDSHAMLDVLLQAHARGELPAYLEQPLAQWRERLF